MAKFVLQSPERKNTKVVLLHSGVTEFDGEGKAEVDVTEDQIKEILNSYENISVEGFNRAIQTEEIKQKAETNDDLSNKQDQESIGGGNEDDDMFKDMPIDEIKKLCSESGFPAEEWENLDESGLKKYLTSKL